MTSAYDIATEVVELLRELTDVSVTFEVEGPVLVPEINRSVDAATVQVQPFEETEEPRDRADMLAGVRTLNVIVQCPLGQDIDEQRCMVWLNELKEAFREYSATATDGEWEWIGNATVVLFDSDAAKEKSQFLSIFRPSFRNFA